MCVGLSESVKLHVCVCLCVCAGCMCECMCGWIGWANLKVVSQICMTLVMDFPPSNLSKLCLEIVYKPSHFIQ